MTKEILYTYLGTNGTVTTPIHLEGVPAMVQYRLKADEGKLLTNGKCKITSATVVEADLSKWKEIDA